MARSWGTLTRAAVVLTVLGAASNAVFADTLQVPSQYPTIQAGIDAAAAGDIVEIADGTYTGDGNRIIDFAGKAITVRGASGDPALCIVDCEGEGMGFTFFNSEGPDSVVEALTVMNGNAVEPYGTAGGGISCFGSDPTIINCIIRDNTAEFDGGGIWVRYGAPTIIDCTFTQNQSGLVGFGGGVALRDSEAVLIRCTISENSTELAGGGGVMAVHGAPTMIDCTISDNSAPAGGGVLANNTALRLVGCAIHDNVATLEDAGGLDCFKSNLTAINCTIARNTAAESGGGVGCYDDSSTLVGCRIVGNTANQGGGGIAVTRSSRTTFINTTITGNDAPLGSALACGPDNLDYQSNPVFRNCIVWNGLDQVWNNDGSTLSVTYSNFQDAVNGLGNISADPLFVDVDGADDDPLTWEDNDYTLSAGSPCNDAGCNYILPFDTLDVDDDGDTSEVLPIDLAGTPRVMDDPAAVDSGCGYAPIVDMGAYEFLGDAGPAPCMGDLDGDRVVDQMDLGVLLPAYGQSAGGDLDCDGDTDQADLGILLSLYGSSCD